MAGYIGSKAVITSGVSASIDELNIIDGVTATTAELNTLDGVTAVVGELNALDIGSTAVGTAVASKAVILDSNKDYTGLRNVTATGVATVGSVVVADGGNIGAASDTDSLAIASNGVVTFSQAPVFPDGSLNLADLDIDGGTDIGAALVDADLMIVDDGAGGTNRKATMSRLATYMGTKGLGATSFISSSDLSDAATASFTGFDASLYDVYEFVLMNVIPATDGAAFQMRTSGNGGTSYDSGASDYKYEFSQGASTRENDNSEAFIKLTKTNVGSASGERGVNGVIKVFGPHIETHTFISGLLSVETDGASMNAVTSSGKRIQATPVVNAVQFFFSSGNIESGTITMYGMVNS